MPSSARPGLSRDPPGAPEPADPGRPPISCRTTGENAANGTNRGCLYAALPPPRRRGGTAQRPVASSQEGHFITLQVLDKIKQAEQEVDAILKKAREDRDATINKARQDALRHIRTAEERARERYEETVKAARQAVEKENADLARAADAEVQAVRQRFETQLGQSKERIIQVFERAVNAQD